MPRDGPPDPTHHKSKEPDHQADQTPMTSDAQKGEAPRRTPPSIDGLSRLVLAGGGPWVSCFLGGIQYMEHVGVMQGIRQFVGCSAGALVAFLLCLGLTAADVRRFMTDKFRKDGCNALDVDQILHAYERCGLDDGRKVARCFEDVLGLYTGRREISFLDFAKVTGKDLVVCVSNISTLNHEFMCVERTPNANVIDALRMTTAVPFLFTPVIYNGSIYVDGGIFNNFPIDYCISKDCTSRDYTSKDYTSRDYTSRDCTSKDGTSKDCTSCTSRDCTSRDCTSRDCTSRDCTSRDCTSRDCTSRDCTSKDCTSRDCVSNDAEIIDTIGFNCLFPKPSPVSAKSSPGAVDLDLDFMSYALKLTSAIVTRSNCLAHDVLRDVDCDSGNAHFFVSHGALVVCFNPLQSQGTGSDDGGSSSGYMNFSMMDLRFDMNDEYIDASMRHGYAFAKNVLAQFGSK